jgi:hypothetical protein
MKLGVQVCQILLLIWAMLELSDVPHNIKNRIKQRKEKKKLESEYNKRLRAVKEMK